MNPTTKITLLEKIESFAVYAGVLLAIIGFIPTNIIPFDTAKTVFIAGSVLLAIFACIVKSIKINSFTIPTGPIAYTSYLLIISTVVSSILSHNFTKSFFGQGFEMYTGSFLILMILGMLFSIRFFDNQDKKVFNIFAIISLAYIFVFLYQIMKLFGGDSFFTMGVFNSVTSSIVGKWYDFSIFSLVASLLSIFAIKFLPIKGKVRVGFFVLFVISLISLLITNFSLSWCILATVSILLGIYEFTSSKVQSDSNSQASKLKKFSIFTLAILIVSILGYWQHDFIGNTIYKAFKVNNIELVLPWQYTLDVSTGTIKESPLFGSGPNRFSYEFLKYKPNTINNTPFWSVEFANGVGVLPTLFVNLGLVGTILWIVFFVLFVRLGMLALKNKNEGFKKYTIVSSFFIALSLWMVMFAYNPSHALYFLTFIFTGIFFGSSLNSNLIRLKEYNLGKQSFLSKVMWLAPFVGVLVVIVWGLIYVKKVIAITYFQKGIKEISTGKSVDNAEKYFTSSNKWDTYDVYYQALSEVSILKINNFTQEFNAKQVKPTEKEVAEVSTMINNGIDNSKKAIEFDATNYYNYTSLARVADVAASLKVANAYENSRGAYIEALKYNPANPAIYLSLAKLDAVNGKIDEAKQNIQRSLILKQDYTDAVFLLSQIQTQNGEIANAIESTKVATQIEPSNSTLFFQLGILYYNNKDYKNAVEALSKAVSLNGQYANARYFLGLAYARLNDDKNAITQFEELVKTNPDNQEVALILSNLKLGKSPFSDAKPPIDSKPEKRSKLPVVEKTNTTKAKTTN